MAAQFELRAPDLMLKLHRAGYLHSEVVLPWLKELGEHFPADEWYREPNGFLGVWSCRWHNADEAEISLYPLADGDRQIVDGEIHRVWVPSPVAPHAALLFIADKAES